MLTLRSFVRRNGRFSKAQRRALETLWPRYGLPDTGGIDLDTAFQRHAPCCLEIGFGMGDTLLELAARHPERNYLGIEVHLPGLGSVLARLETGGFNNVRISRIDAVQVLSSQLPPQSMQSVYIFFPDPWPKKRHHKRRLIQPEFLRLLQRIMEPGGALYLATDWEDYAMHMLEVLDTAPDWLNNAGTGNFIPRQPERPLTKFERRGLRLGHQVWDLAYTLKKG